MRRLFAFIVTALLLSVGMAMAAPSSDNNDGKKTEQNTEKKKNEKKEDKKSEKKDDSKSADKPHKPIDLIYEFGWPWIMR